MYDKLVTKVNSIDISECALNTNSALPAVENEIPDISDLVKKTDYNAEIRKLVKLKIKSLIMIMINILLLQNLIS